MTDGFIVIWKGEPWLGVNGADKQLTGTREECNSIASGLHQNGCGVRYCGPIARLQAEQELSRRRYSIFWGDGYIGPPAHNNTVDDFCDRKGWRAEHLAKVLTLAKGEAMTVTDLNGPVTVVRSK